MSGIRGSLLVIMTIILTGCAAVAPSYVPSPTSVQKLSASKPGSARVGEFSAAKDAPNTSMALRGSTMQPAQGTYAKYLSDAIRLELELAKLHSAIAATEISGVLLKNDINTGLADRAEGVIEAQFIVRRDGQVRFDKVKATKTQWETSFIGAIAIPRAQQEYPRLVQQLVSELFADPDFISALK
jgi:hypothetical protein